VNVEDVIPVEVSRELAGLVAQSSVAMRRGRKLQNMSAAQRRMPVMSAMATAYFVDSSPVPGLKQTTDVSWENKFIEAEEVAVIVPISQHQLDDSDFDIWAEVKPALVTAFGKTIDQAVLYETNIPASWKTNMGGTGIVAGATAASKVVSIAAYDDTYAAILGAKADGTPGLFGQVEKGGRMVTGSVAAFPMMGRLRNVREMVWDGTELVPAGQPLFTQTNGQFSLNGSPVDFPENGSVVEANGLMIAGQWDQLLYAMRQDMTYRVLDQAVITDNQGTIIYNLAQQDMVALRAVMRIGFALPNQITAGGASATSRYPFAVLTA
jgi:hypothetical protein